jgi:dipeptidyl aminopeptidase/acylaminoacyl peptidase
VGWQEAKPQKYVFDQKLKGIYDELAAQLPGNEIKIIDRDSSETNMIINTYNDRNPGNYYLYSTNTKKLVKLADMNADIDQAQLCEMKPISFKAGDGTVINGYLTLPKDVEAINLPVVVIPHGDPWRRNNWGYSSEVQFLANRGYAVFQVNYRGSTGYGKAFYSAGFKQLGGKMQQDITDGVIWLITQKIANPKKIAIYGWGFGGFSALYGAAFHPALYNCVAVQNPLINLFTYVKNIPPWYKSMLAMRYEMVGDPENAADASMFTAISPVGNTDKIKAPLLFVQNEDPRINMTEMDQFRTELGKKGVAVTYKFIKREDGGHGGGKHGKGSHGGGPGSGHGGPRVSEQNREAIYTELEKFLASNLQDKK